MRTILLVIWLVILSVLWPLSAATIEPGRIIQNLLSSDPNNLISVNPGERITTYLSAASLPWTPTYTGFSAVVDGLSAAGETVSVDLLTWSGARIASDTATYHPGSLTYLDEAGVPHSVPIASATNATPMPMPAGLFDSRGGSRGMFRADFINNTSAPVDMRWITISFTYVTVDSEGHVSTTGRAALPGQIYTPTEIPEPGTFTFAGSMLLSLGAYRRMKS